MAAVYPFAFTQAITRVATNPSYLTFANPYPVSE